MKHILPIFVFSAILFTACNQNAPTTYDKVAGHTYVTNYQSHKALPDTLSFLSNGTIPSSINGVEYTYTQEEQLLLIKTQYSEYQLEVMHNKIVYWDGNCYYNRID